MELFIALGQFLRLRYQNRIVHSVDEYCTYIYFITVMECILTTIGIVFNY